MVFDSETSFDMFVYTNIYGEKEMEMLYAYWYFLLLTIFILGGLRFTSTLNTRLTQHASQLSRAPKCLGHMPTASNNLHTM